MKKYGLLFIGFMFFASNLTFSMCEDWDIELQKLNDSSSDQDITEYVHKYIHGLCPAIDLGMVSDNVQRKIKIKTLLPLKDYIIKKFARDSENFAFTANFFRRWVRDYEHIVDENEKNYLYVVVNNRGILKYDLHKSEVLEDVIKSVDVLGPIGAANYYRGDDKQMLALGVLANNQFCVKYYIDNDWDFVYPGVAQDHQDEISKIVQTTPDYLFTNQLPPDFQHNWLRYDIDEERGTLGGGRHLGSRGVEYLNSVIYADANTIITYSIAESKIIIKQQNIEGKIDSDLHFPFCAVSANGKKMVLAQANGTLKLFSIEESQNKTKLNIDELATKENVHDDNRKINVIAYGVYGKFIITGSNHNGEIKLWEIKNDTFEEYHSFVVDSWQQGTSEFKAAYFGLDNKLRTTLDKFRQLVELNIFQIRVIYKTFLKKYLSRDEMATYNGLSNEHKEIIEQTFNIGPPKDLWGYLKSLGFKTGKAVGKVAFVALTLLIVYQLEKHSDTVSAIEKTIIINGAKFLNIALEEYPPS